MDLTQLQYFRAAAHRGHFTQAADELHITQPALSKMISHLESDLGVKLFDRDGKRIRLNTYGEVVLRYADQIFRALDQMNREISDLQGGVTGNIRISVSVPNREPDPLLAVVTQFMRDFPQVCVSFNYTNAKAIREGLLDGSLDLAVTNSAIAGREIQWTLLYEEQLGIILARDHPLAGKPEVCMADLEDEWFYCNNAGNDYKDLTYSFCARAGFAPKVRFEGFAPDYIGSCVSRGEGISFIAEQKFRSQMVRDMELHVRPWAENITFRRVTEPYCVRDCGLAYLKDRYQTRAVQELSGRLVETFTQTQGKHL